MAIIAGYPWATVGRLMAFFALLIVVLMALVPGVPDWALLLAVGLLALGILVG